MSIEHLIGRHFRLQQELAVAYGAVPWNTGHIDRLTDDLARTEREIAAAAATTASQANANAASRQIAPPSRQPTPVGIASLPLPGAQ